MPSYTDKFKRSYSLVNIKKKASRKPSFGNHLDIPRNTLNPKASYPRSIIDYKDIRTESNQEIIPRSSQPVRVVRKSSAPPALIVSSCPCLTV
mmetsp:Transcript_12813/g.27036  ORF Transcript_12813/g.27036 Transcript_12813/m.27036 type:complete len:93 (+) Transcript_12813:53-331(+)